MSGRPSAAYSRRMTDDIVVIHTDGGCRPNPGPGGWGAVLRSVSTFARCAVASPARPATTGWS